MLDAIALGELLIDFATVDTDRDGYPTLAAHPGGAPGNFLAALHAYVNKQQRPQKFKVREYTRCERCGRPHSVLRKYKLCRICFRELAYKGQIPGVKKASW